MSTATRFGITCRYREQSRAQTDAVEAARLRLEQAVLRLFVAGRQQPVSNWSFGDIAAPR
jgi:hypothetical protein